MPLCTLLFQGLPLLPMCNLRNRKIRSLSTSTHVITSLSRCVALTYLRNHELLMLKLPSLFLGMQEQSHLTTSFFIT